MIRLPPGYTRSYTPFPYTTLIRSLHGWSPREGRCIHRMPAEEAWCCCWFDRITALAVSASATQDLQQSLELLWCFHRCTPLAMAAHSRSEEHTSELQSLMRISYAVFCLKKKKQQHKYHTIYQY